jgi:thymidylate synthase
MAAELTTCNLNFRLPQFANPAAMLADLSAITATHKRVRNYAGVVTDMSRAVLTVETELFPADALEFYTLHNLDELRPDTNKEHAALYEKFYNAARGGGQGDYREGIKAKIDNVVDCLRLRPESKRAVLTIPPVTTDHSVDGFAKCLRELHFYIEAREDEDGTKASETEALHCTGFMRAQAASIFPKNIHYIGTVMNVVAERLGKPVGTYTHYVTTLTNER